MRIYMWLTNHFTLVNCKEKLPSMGENSLVLTIEKKYSMAEAIKGPPFSDFFC